MAIEKIVVVDDEMMIRKALETQLRSNMYSVASTGDLKDARKFLPSPNVSQSKLFLIKFDNDLLFAKGCSIFI
jgi:DNA-binding NtrC family response regulator